MANDSANIPAHKISKGGVTYNEAIILGMKKARMAARRHSKWFRCGADKDDLLGAAYEGIVLAWKAWNPESVSWEHAAWCYAELYARREGNRRKSVVQTNSSRYGKDGARRGERDEGMVVRGADGEWTERDIESGIPGADERIESIEALREVMAALREAASTVTEREAIATDVIVRRIATDAPESAAALAERHKVTAAYIYKIEKALRASVGI